MSAISREEVAHLAMLARIDLAPAELDRLAGQLGAILDSVATVQQIAGEDVPATSHPMPLTNVTRPDEPRPCLDADEALSGAPETEQQRFRVPRILQED
jgi:aspartyl-tRNA(Asn)/glutamyl-tRNA(Gln) amidotransferase subunit C